jgi:hypothetical protein
MSHPRRVIDGFSVDFCNATSLKTAEFSGGGVMSWEEFSKTTLRSKLSPLDPTASCANRGA